MYRKIQSKDTWFNNWLRKRLPKGSEGLVISDIDFVLYNYKKKTIMLLELKQFGSVVKLWQRSLFEILHRSLLNGLPEDYTYLGFHCITFPERGFDEQEHVKFDNTYITEKELIKRLNI